MSEGSPSQSCAVCTCNTCCGHLEFDPANAGQRVECPHCGLETVLFVPDEAPPQPPPAGTEEPPMTLTAYRQRKPKEQAEPPKQAEFIVKTSCRETGVE